MEDTKGAKHGRLKVGCLFLHTLGGSLGSFTRVKELSISCAGRGVDTCILTPYEHDRSLSDGVSICSIPNFALKIGLAYRLYEVSRKLYYKKYVSQLLNGRRSGLLLDRFSDKLLKVLGINGIQVLQAEQDFSLPVCTRVKKRTGIPLIADVHNITSEELVAAGVIERDGKEFRALQHNTSENLSTADFVVVVSDLMKEYVQSEYNISSAKVILVPPGGRPRVKRIASNPSHNLVYSGLASYRENIELFVRSMPRIRDRFDDVKFFITRKGEMINALTKLASQLNVKLNFFWYDNVDDLYDFLSSCYAGILPSSDDLARRMGTPVKLFDYMSLGLPVVANDIGGWTEIISKHKAGILTGSEPSQFADGITDLLANDRGEYAENALELVREKYNWDNSALPLVKCYNNLVNR